MGRNGFRYQRQADSGSARRPATRPSGGETIEDALPIRFRHTGTGVIDIDYRHRTHAAQRDGNHTSTVTYGIVEQIRKGAFQLQLAATDRRISHHRQQIRALTTAGDRMNEQRTDRQRFGIPPMYACFEAGQFQHVIEGAAQVIHLIGH